MSGSCPVGATVCRDAHAEAERLRGWKAEALPVFDGLQELGKALGLPLGSQITGTEALAEVARLTAERDALAAQVARVEALASHWEYLMGKGGSDGKMLTWRTAAAISALALRDALAGSEADTGEQETGHKCEPYYSRSECGLCGWQEQWCATCSRQMCGCATGATALDAMGADQ